MTVFNEYMEIELCDSTQCTACGACLNACPKESISFIEDMEGFIQPSINQTTCIKCGTCMKACPNLNRQFIISVLEKRYKNPFFYGCWHKNNSIRLCSSSGGAFTAIAQYVLNKGGVVFGAKYSSNLKVIHDSISEINELDELRRSKYLQSEVGYSFRQVRKCLENKKLVVFCGTPCQIDGLYGYLHHDYENLLTVSLICHGVPSYRMFRKYADWIESRYRKKLLSYNFRSKKYGWDDGTVSVVNFEGEQEEKELKGKENCFQASLLKNLCLRKSCYQCPSHGIHRSSDFTISDLWAVFRIADISKYDCPYKGISMLAINSLKAQNAFSNGIKDYLSVVEIRSEIVTIDNPQYVNSACCNGKRNAFLREINTNVSWDSVYRKYLKKSAYEKFVLWTKIIFPPFFAFKIRRLIKRIKK